MRQTPVCMNEFFVLQTLIEANGQNLTQATEQMLLHLTKHFIQVQIKLVADCCLSMIALALIVCRVSV